MPLFGPPNIDKLKQDHDVQGLVKAAGHKDQIVRLNAENALRECLQELGTAAAGPLIHAAICNANVHAMDALRTLGTAAVIACLHDDDRLVREEAAEVLGKLGDIQAVEPLISVLEDEDEEVSARARAAQSLGELGVARAVQPLIAAPDDDEVVQAGATYGLGELGDTEVETVPAEHRPQELDPVLGGTGLKWGELQMARIRLTTRMGGRLVIAGIVLSGAVLLAYLAIFVQLWLIAVLVFVGPIGVAVAAWLARDAHLMAQDLLAKPVTVVTSVSSKRREESSAGQYASVTHHMSFGAPLSESFEVSGGEFKRFNKGNRVMVSYYPRSKTIASIKKASNRP
jgi:hypothetical protein